MLNNSIAFTYEGSEPKLWREESDIWVHDYCMLPPPPSPPPPSSCLSFFITLLFMLPKHGEPLGPTSICKYNRLMSLICKSTFHLTPLPTLVCMPATSILPPLSLSLLHTFPFPSFPHFHPALKANGLLKVSRVQHLS